MSKPCYFNAQGYSKYGNQKVTIDGITFDSKKEAARYAELRLLLRAGVISDLRRQVRFELIPKQTDENGKTIESSAAYIADFVYKDKDGNNVVEDTKGFRTDTYVLKRKLMLFLKGIRIKEI